MHVACVFVEQAGKRLWWKGVEITVRVAERPNSLLKECTGSVAVRVRTAQWIVLRA